MRSELTRELMRAASLDDIVDCATRILRFDYSADEVSIFFYSKEGRLTRAIPRAGADEAWPTETYSIGEVGSVVRASSTTEDPERGTVDHGHARDYVWPDDAIRRHAIDRLGNDWNFMLLPLDGPNRTFGVLRLIRTVSRGDDFTPEERSKLSVSASRIAGTISNMRRDAEINVYAQIQKILAAPDVSIEQIGELVAHALTTGATEFAACVVRIADRHNQLQIAGMEALPEIALADKSRVPREHGASLVGRVFMTGEPVIVSDVQSHLDLFEDHSFVHKYAFRTFGCFPIGQFPRIVGTISLFMLYGYTFYPTKLNFLEEVSRHLATAIHVARLLETRSKALTTQQSVATSVDSVDGILHWIVDRSVELTGASTAFLSRTSRRKKFLQDYIPAWNLPISAIPPLRTDGPGHTSAAIAQRMPINCHDVTAHTNCGGTYVDLLGEWAGRVQSELIVPLLYGHEPIGALNLVAERPHHFTRDDELLAESIAAQASALIQRGRFFKSASSLDRLALPRDDRDQLYERIAKAGAHLGDVDVAVLAVPDTKRGLLRIGAVLQGGRITVYPEGESELLEVNRRRADIDSHDAREVTTAVIADIETTDARIDSLLKAMEQIILVPLSAPIASGGWEDFGLLILGAAAPLPLFDEERQILTALGRAAAFGLKEMMLLDERDLAFDRAERNAHLLSVAEIAAGLAHDTNNILNNLSAAFITAKDQLAEVVVADAGLQEAFTLIDEAIEKLAIYFGQLRRYRQFQEPDFHEEQLQSIVDESLALMNHRITKQRVRVRRFYDHIPPVECDREGLVQVIVNLIRNALDAMKERGSLFVGVARYGEYAEIRLIDDGTGIEDSRKARIFERGYTTKDTGTGIGLAICKQIVEEIHRGRLDFESKRGRGATFFVRLPFHITTDEVGHAASKNATS